ncbi:uncharacterized protein LOC109135381 [Beta vulgaris subsp. vulgaris]|uniref:uncharacterized protein LOC109135381 n=1 Tax=Beta vulgaris subsp. vulgaris TaxID=3555 RepID=UPI000901ECBD|nr:uncharacterized protein LOC109135381 [Beta vulgaris subsp. vulgaris]
MFISSNHSLKPLEFSSENRHPNHPQIPLFFATLSLLCFRSATVALPPSTEYHLAPTTTPSPTQPPFSVALIISLSRSASLFLAQFVLSLLCLVCCAHRQNHHAPRYPAVPSVLRCLASPRRSFALPPCCLVRRKAEIKRKGYYSLPRLSRLLSRNPGMSIAIASALLIRNMFKGKCAVSGVREIII